MNTVLTRPPTCTLGYSAFKNLLALRTRFIGQFLKTDFLAENFTPKQGRKVLPLLPLLPRLEIAKNEVNP